MRATGGPEMGRAARGDRSDRFRRHQSPEPLLGEKAPRGIYAKCLTLPHDVQT